MVFFFLSYLNPYFALLLIATSVFGLFHAAQTPFVHQYEIGAITSQCTLPGIPQNVGRQRPRL